jgi:hypothetical protein
MAPSSRGSVGAAGQAGNGQAAGSVAVGNLTTSSGSGLPLPRSELMAASLSISRCMARVTAGADPGAYSPAETAQLMSDLSRIGALASILDPLAGLVSLSSTGGAAGAEVDSTARVVVRLRRNFGQLGYMAGVLDENLAQIDGRLAGIDGLDGAEKPAGAEPEDSADFDLDPTALSEDELEGARSTWAARADRDFDALIRAQLEMNDLDDRRRNLDHQVDAVSELLARLDDARTAAMPAHLGDTLRYGLGWHSGGDATRMAAALRDSRAVARAAAAFAPPPGPAPMPASTAGAASGGNGSTRHKVATFAEWAAANHFEGGRMAVLQALAGLQRWCGFYDALTGTLARQLVALRCQADAASAGRRALSGEMQRRALERSEEPSAG